MSKEKEVKNKEDKKAPLRTPKEKKAAKNLKKQKRNSED
jgi:hypothetical protein